MKRTEVICDRCSKTITEKYSDGFEILYEVLSADVCKIQKLRRKREQNLCFDCVKSFVDLCNAFFTEAHSVKD